MANSNLLKEAIADAKAVRETALANAKIALEEAFTPRIQSMLSAKLAEEEEMEEAAEEPVETNGDGMDAAAGAEVSEGEHGDEEMMLPFSKNFIIKIDRDLRVIILSSSIKTLIN